jgi:hypothetical protein
MWIPKGKLGCCYQKEEEIEARQSKFKMSVTETPRLALVQVNMSPGSYMV